MITILVLYILGIVALIGCFCGAEHHAMTATVCLVLATRLLQEWAEGRKELRRSGGLNS